MNDESTADRLIAIGKREDPKAGKDGRLPMLKQGSTDWLAWRSYRVENNLGVGFMDTQEWWCVPRRSPPAGGEPAVEDAGYKDRMRRRVAYDD